MGILRILLAISVLASHLHGGAVLGFRLIYGDMAVQCFYMVSGFYMALVLNRKYRPGQYWLFLQQRYLRLIPAYWVILLINIVVAFFFYVPQNYTHPFYLGWLRDYHVPNLFSWAYIVFLNLFLIGSDSFFYTALTPGTGSLYFTLSCPYQPCPLSNYQFVFPAWSLGVELLFYICAPYLVRQRPLVQIAFLVGSCSLRWGSSFFTDIHTDLLHFRFFPFELAFFMAGSLAYQIYARSDAFFTRHLMVLKWAQYLFYAVVVAYSRLPGAADDRFAVFMVLLFFMIPVLFYLSKDNAADRLIGELSYPFYLSHPVIIVLTEALVTRGFPPNRWGICYVLLSLAFSYLLYRFFESKTDAWRHALFEKKQSIRPRPAIE